MDTLKDKPAGFRDLLPRDKVDAWCERGIVGLVLAVAVYGPLGLGAVRPSEFLVLQFLTVGVLLLWLVRYWFGKTHRLLWTPICWPVVGFVAYAIFRYATAEIEAVARQELIRVLVYAALFLATLTHLHRQQSTRIMALTLIGLGTALSLYALYQWVTSSEYVWHFLRPHCYFMRASGSYICPDHFAGFLSMLMPVALSFTLTGRFKPVPRVLLGYATVMMVAGLAVTVSYGAWLATALALAVLFAGILRRRSYRPIGISALAVLLVLAALFYEISLKPRARLLAAQGFHYERSPWKGVWPAAWRMWRDHFWLGVGPGHFDYRYREYRQESPDQQSRPGRVHNDYLNTLVDWGVIGAALVAAAWLALFWGVVRGWKYIRRSASDLTQKRSNKSAFVLGASLGLFALAIESFYDFNMHIPANAILAVILMALISGHLRFTSERYWVTQRRLGTVLGTIFLGSAALYLAVQGWRLAHQQYWLGRAAAEATGSTAQLAALQKAFAAEPKDFETAYAIGEHLRVRAMGSEDGGPELAAEAIAWYQRSLALNRYDAYSHMRIGLCTHWLGYPERADEWYEKAVRLDPNSYFMLAQAGWHWLNSARLEKARESLEKSLRLKPDNPLAEAYLKQLETAARQTKP